MATHKYRPDEFKTLWNKFCSQVLPNGSYKKVQYQTYKFINNLIAKTTSQDEFKISTITGGYKITSSADSYNYCTFCVTDNSFGTFLYQEYHDTIKNKKENDVVNSKSFNFEFGPVNDNSIRMSVYGMAIRNKNNSWVAYDKSKRQIVDVDIFNVNGQGLYYKMPVALVNVAVGDIVIHNQIPCFVMSLKNDGTMYAFEVMDINEGTIKTIVPATNMFNFNYMTKIVSLIDMTGMNTPDENNPFGGMLPLLMLGNNANASDIMILMAMNGNKMGDMNPWMLAMMMNSDNNSSFRNILPILMLTNKKEKTSDTE